MWYAAVSFRRVVNSILAEMDCLEDLHDVVVLAATNRPDLIDSALLRPGRFDRIIATKIPDKKTRLEIFKIHTKPMPLAKDVSLEKLTDKTENFNGADIQALCREAALNALRNNQEADKVTMEDFEKVLQKTQPSVKEEDAKRYKQIEETYIKSARAAQVIPKPTYLG